MFFSEMIKEMSIRILDGENEMFPAWYCVYDVDERNADDTAASRAIYRRQRKLRKNLIGAYREKHRIVFKNNAFPFEINQEFKTLVLFWYTLVL